MSNSNNPLILEPLTARESEILNLIAEGLSNPEIANQLVIGIETVRWYTKQIYSKLGVHSRTQAIHHAQALGLLGEPQLLAVTPAESHSQSNLPTYSSSFVGRENEFAELTSLLE